MARVFTDGAEFGDMLFADSYSGTNTSNVVSTAGFSGNRKYRISGSSGQNISRNIPSLAEFYVRTRLLFDEYKAGTYIPQWRNGSTQLGSIRINTATGFIEIYTSTGTLVATGTISMGINNVYLVEVHVKLAEAPNGVIEVKIDGVSDASFTGDTIPAALTTVDNINWQPPTNMNLYIDDLALNDTTGGVDDSWCGDGRIVILSPDSAGDITQLYLSGAASNYDAVNEIPPNSDTDYVYGDTVGLYDLYNLTAFSENPNISRIWVEARARGTVADGEQIRTVIKTGGAEYQSLALNMLTSYDRIVGPDYTTNPDTAVAWTDSDLDNLQAGVKIA